MNSETKICQNCTQKFVIEPQDFAFYEKMSVPPPTFCPQCRLQRRFMFYNERGLYKRECDLCGKGIITMYAPEKKLTVYCNSCWWSDKWDPLEYGQEYDSSRSFFEQFKELAEKTPQMPLEVNYPTLVNSEYINHASTAKNCYLIYTADECENVLYSEVLAHDKDSMDVTMCGGLELCYQLINSGPGFRMFYSEDCENCQEVYFSKDLSGCNNCFGCVGLRKKSYCIFNEQYTKEEYQRKLKEFGVDSYKNVEALRQQALAFWKKYPHKFAHTLRNLNVTGDYIYSSKNAKDMYVVHEGAEDCRYCGILTMPPAKDCYDYNIWGNGAQRVYECIIVGEAADTIKFSYQAWSSVRNIEYSFFAVSSSNLFGCANTRNKQYCILNKQYTKEEYEKLREKIIQDMSDRPYTDKAGKVYKYGEFFPPETSLSSYNESYANDFFPLTKEEAEVKGFSWYTPQPNPHQPTIAAAEIPDSINDVQDSIIKEIIECTGCEKPFRIVTAELSLLRRFGLPAPRKCPNCRYKERFSRLNPPQLYRRSCQCLGSRSENGAYSNTSMHSHDSDRCPNEFETAYSPEREEIVYCEQCYQAEVA